MQRAWRLVKRFARLELAHRPVIDLHLIGAFEHITKGMVPRMPMRISCSYTALPIPEQAKGCGAD